MPRASAAHARPVVVQITADCCFIHLPAWVVSFDTPSAIKYNNQAQNAQVWLA